MKIKFYSNFKVFAKEIKCSNKCIQKILKRIKRLKKIEQEEKNSEPQKQEKGHLRRKKRNIKILLQKLLHKLFQE